MHTDEISSISLTLLSQFNFRHSFKPPKKQCADTSHSCVCDSAERPALRRGVELKYDGTAECEFTHTAMMRGYC